jgi:hypothetical protein
VHALGAEGVQQLSLTIEDLYHAQQSIHNVEIAFRIDTDSLRPENRAGTVTDLRWNT